MPTITVNKYAAGATGGKLAKSTTQAMVFQGVIDVPEAIKGTSYAAGDTVVIKVGTIPAGAIYHASAWSVVEAFPASTTFNAGFPVGDPDEWVDAQTISAIATTLTQTAASLATAIYTSDTDIFISVYNAGSITTGKIAFTIEAVQPAKEAPALGGYFSGYTHTPASTD